MMTPRPDRPAAAEPTTGLASGRWSQDRRLEFIDFRLRWDGRLNRSDLTDFFGISVPQASLDIARYAELAPANLTYDRHARVYVASSHFQPVFASSDAGRYLDSLLARATGLDAGACSFLEWAPPVAAVPGPGRRVDVGILAAILRAVREGTAIRVRYQSMTSAQARSRVLSPHAFAHDGFRWHVRAFCHARRAFRDFVMARMLQVEGVEPAGACAQEDQAWHTLVPLVLGPHPDLPPAHRRAIEFDYGMAEGRVEFRCRQAFLFYALRHLRLDLEGDLEGTALPQLRQITLLNRQEIAHLLPAPGSPG